MKILLVDDHTLFREGVTLLLQRFDAPVEVVAAGSCEEAFRIADAATDLDLIIIDLSMPGMSGLDGIVVLRERHPEIPVVALSSNDDKDTVLGVLDRGAMGFIPKTSSADVMLAALRLILSKGIYLPPSVFLGDQGVGPSARRRVNSSDASAPTTPADIGLTGRQAAVLFLILQGKPIKTISRELGLSASAVKAHTSAVLRALNVTTRTQAIVAAGKIGLRF
jgi:DNA-binding NarL/FixJ family response regulator